MPELYNVPLHLSGRPQASKEHAPMAHYLTIEASNVEELSDIKQEERYRYEAEVSS